MSMIYGGNNITFPDGSTQNVAPNNFGFKNRIINGHPMIDQRNAGASVTPNASYTLDRWVVNNAQTGKFTVQQNAGSVTPPAGFINYLGVTSASAYSVLSTDFFNIQQNIEGLNVADLGWGTANAQAVTLSFKVYSSLTGTFGGSLRNNASDRSYPFTYTISSANTWTSISVTIAGDTSGTWLTTNGVGIKVGFSLGAGSTYSGTAGAWASGNYFQPTSTVSVVGTNGATFYITGIQLEKGSTATSFDYRPYGTELALCQRYFDKSYPQGTVPGVFNYSGVIITIAYNDSNLATQGMRWKQTMRATPTVKIYAQNGTLNAVYRVYTGATVNVSGAANAGDSGNWLVTSSAAFVANEPYYFHYTAEAEL